MSLPAGNDVGSARIFRKWGTPVRWIVCGKSVLHQLRSRPSPPEAMSVTVVFVSYHELWLGARKPRRCA